MYASSYFGTLALLFAAMFAIAGTSISALAYAAREYAASHSGLIAGLGSAGFSLVVALEMPLVGRLFDLRSFHAAFTFATVLPVLGCAVWRL